MKKLMTMIGAAVAAFGLFADTTSLVESNVDFTKMDPGEYSFEEEDPDAGEVLWYKTGDAEGTITAGDPDNFLALEADAPVYRTAAGVDVTPAQVAIADVEAEQGGIIFDQKVKFSAFDIDTQVPEGLDTEGAKIAVWVKTVQEEDGETPAINHLMITAGNLDIMLTPDTDTPFVTKELTTENIDVNEFYQLTITAIEAGTANGKVIPGFKVALDGVDIALAEGLFPADPSLGGGTYSAEGADLIKVNKLFPSLVKYSLDDAGTLQGVAFKGTGAIESIDITAKGLYNIEVAITAPAGAIITGVTQDDAAVEFKNGKWILTPGKDATISLARDGYNIVDPLSVTKEISGSTTEIDLSEDVDVTPAVAQIVTNEGATTNLFATLPAAVAAAEAGQTVEMVSSVTLDDTLVIDEAITLDMFGYEIKLAADKAVGIDVTAAATIQNGDITSTRETYGTAYMILNEAVAATYENLNIYAANYKFGLTCDSPGDLQGECENAPTVTVTCKNVDIIGNGTMFYAQHTILNLDAYCSATKDPTLTSGGYAAAVYSALNATVTIAGGAYEHDYALISGNLGGQIIVNGGEFKGDIKSWMKVGAHTELEGLDGYKAKFVFNDGTYTGDIVFEDADARALDSFWKNDAVTLIAPDGYKWDAAGFLVKDVEPETYTVTFTTNDVPYVVVDAVVSNTAFADVKPVDPVIEGFTFKGWTPVVEVIDGTELTFAAVLEAEASGWDVPTGDEDKPAQQVWKTIPSNLADVPAGKLSTWAKANEVPFGGEFTETMSDAYLLDCAPTAEKVAEEKAKINIASIEFVDNEWVIKTVSEDEAGDEFGNGKLELVDVTKDVTGAEGSDAAKLWKMKLVPITAK